MGASGKRIIKAQEKEVVAVERSLEKSIEELEEWKSRNELLTNVAGVAPVTGGSQ